MPQNPHPQKNNAADHALAESHVTEQQATQHENGVAWLSSPISSQNSRHRAAIY
jgi:hypothetical protein